MTAGAQTYSIYEIQYTTDPNGYSPLAGEVIDCSGGIVTHKFGGFRPKLTIQNPNFPDGWGAIQVKDWLTGYPFYNKAQVGDWVTLSNVYVEEYYGGGTTLQCWGSNNPDLTVISSNNPLPEPLVIDANQIPAPVRDSYGDYWVIDHRAEQYEHMCLTVQRNFVIDVNYGKAGDNYILQDIHQPNDANHSFWAADYMNTDTIGDYHPYVEIGRQFCSITGILEHYQRPDYGWDYYQLVTTGTSDFLLWDMDDDCDFDFRDYCVLAYHWLADGPCQDNDWCGHADMDHDDTVDGFDLDIFSQHWLKQNE